MRPITFVRLPAETMPQGVLFRENWLKLKGPGDIAYCPLPNFGEGWVLTRIREPRAEAQAPAADST